MKAHSGFFDLIMVMVFIVAAVPLLLSLVRVCNNSEYRYLDDKTTYTMAESVEYVTVTSPTGGKKMVPVNLAPIRLDYGAAQVIALIQDDYCPSSGTRLNWKLTANTPWGYDTVAAANVPYIKKQASDVNTLVITKGWTAKRVDQFGALHNAVSAPMKIVNGAQTAKDVFYLVWDFEADCWMITHEFVNIFEER